MIREACVFNIAEAINAFKLGANRIELCENTTCGGTTPSYGNIRILREELSIPIAVMIRPRCGDFMYSNLEFQAMKEDIKICKALGVEGVVFGILDGYEIDIARTRELLDLAKPLKVTFHKAIDNTCDIRASVLKLMDIGVHRVLTSGGALRAEDSLALLKDLILLVGDKLEIVVCGKVNEQNIDGLDSILGAQAYHGRLIVGDLNF
ncbi:MULTISPECIES: copper homeostasis protein CutC [unclassified Borrelia]|uniref:copper homeostasis protein CutC n=1 Tax=unclassified Borrelia TaxID=2649934 RepID=UPI001E33E830|nr:MULTISPECIES: copper homeostasis protein CutC [unclassified Borrelia]UGQ16477.1 copper homeostasis protein CutC [Borrelia sp. RT5S]UGQ17604.1 copper homeostasis protein CutC [Borrelia sp. RT1S]